MAFERDNEDIQSPEMAEFNHRFGFSEGLKVSFTKVKYEDIAELVDPSESSTMSERSLCIVRVSPPTSSSLLLKTWISC